MANLWFGARWFGIRIRVPIKPTIPLIREAYESKPPGPQPPINH